jgi:hypothetical protein
MLPSLHDWYLVAYEVHCERRIIKLHARHYDRAKEVGTHTLTVVFEGVDGYHFKNDAMGNIIFSLQSVSIETLLSDHLLEMAESFREAGAFGPWAGDPAAAPGLLVAKGLRGFLLSSSFGLSGWVLAAEAFVATSEDVRPTT